MAGFSSSGGGSFDYVQTSTPSNPQKGESWYDTDADGVDGRVKVYDGANWNPTGFTSHGNLTDVTESDHHKPVSVSGPLTEDGTQGLDLTTGDGLTVDAGTLVAAFAQGLTVDGDGNLAVPIGNALTVDGDGNIAVSEGSISHNNLSNVSSSQHHTRYTDSEAQAATHDRYTDQEAESVADNYDPILSPGLIE
jgi:hypothetical protein